MLHTMPPSGGFFDAVIPASFPPKDQLVFLHKYEVELALYFGARARKQMLDRGAREARGAAGDRGMQDQCNGYAGEFSLCKAADVCWSPRLDTFHRIADIGSSWEVKTVRFHAVRGIPSHLPLPPDQLSDDKTYWLVTGSIYDGDPIANRLADAPAFHIPGYISGANILRLLDAGDPDIWLDHLGHPERPPIYCIAQSKLTPLPQNIWKSLYLRVRDEKRAGLFRP